MQRLQSILNTQKKKNQIAKEFLSSSQEKTTSLFIHGIQILTRNYSVHQTEGLHFNWKSPDIFFSRFRRGHILWQFYWNRKLFGFSVCWIIFWFAFCRRYFGEWDYSLNCWKCKVVLAMTYSRVNSTPRKVYAKHKQPKPVVTSQRVIKLSSNNFEKA